MKINLKGRHLDHHYYLLTGREAWKLAREAQKDRPKAHAPRWGFEMQVDVNGQLAWLTRTLVLGRPAWAVYSRDLLVE